MLNFATTIDNIRDRLEQQNNALTLLSKTPFWTLIEAYIQKRLIKVECMKSNYDIVRLIQDYDRKTRKFKFNDGDSEMKSQDVAEIFGLPNKGKKLPSTTTSTRLDFHFVKKYFIGYKKITKTSIDKCLNLALEDETKEGPVDNKIDNPTTLHDQSLLQLWLYTCLDIYNHNRHLRRYREI
ncbi:hypothetical protein L3X38_037560 [Prunus dulcis]|uniref:Uncharacterized protein n=1 Tax=Prunus dulcis TaxID=3755 RepID=A0AAD4V3Z7_PRUDU|nr:hypothetical protein L3X38_037560 [Prunus dulcis]